MFMIVEVKNPYSIWAIVPAVTGTDTTVIDLAVQAIGIMVTCIDRAYGFARSVMAVLTKNRQKTHPYFWIFANPKALYAEPVHISSLGYLFFLTDGNVIFCLTGDHASTAARAAVKVYNHSPFVWTRQFFHC